MEYISVHNIACRGVCKETAGLSIMLACHRRCAQQTVQLARLISHSHASTAASVSLEGSPETRSVEALRSKLAKGTFSALVKKDVHRHTAFVVKISHSQYLLSLRGSS